MTYKNLFLRFIKQNIKINRNNFISKFNISYLKFSLAFSQTNKYLVEFFTK